MNDIYKQPALDGNTDAEHLALKHHYITFEMNLLAVSTLIFVLDEFGESMDHGDVDTRILFKEIRRHVGNIDEMLTDDEVIRTTAWLSSKLEEKRLEMIHGTSDTVIN